MFKNTDRHSYNNVGDVVLENKDLKERISRLESDIEIYKSTIDSLEKQNDELARKYKAAYNNLSDQLEEIHDIRRHLRKSINDVILMKADYEKQFKSIIKTTKKDERWISKNTDKDKQTDTTEAAGN